MSLLGGLSSEATAITEWKEEKEDDSDSNNVKNETASAPSSTAIHHQQTILHSITKNILDKNSSTENKEIFKRAFQLSLSGQILKFPVQIVDQSKLNQGNILIATSSILKGQVIFTERALEGAQVPFGHCSSIYTVRACQHCFKSLEPASCLSKESSDSDATSIHNNDADHGNSSGNCTGTGTIPMPELWPVPEYDSMEESNKHGKKLTKDSQDIGREHLNLMKADRRSGRMTCTNSECGAIFCSRFCAKSHLETMGSCCGCAKAIQKLVHMHTVCCDKEDGQDPPRGEHKEDKRTRTRSKILHVRHHPQYK